MQHSPCVRIREHYMRNGIGKTLVFGRISYSDTQLQKVPPFVFETTKVPYSTGTLRN